MYTKRVLAITAAVIISAAILFLALEMTRRAVNAIMFQQTPVHNVMRLL